MALKIDKIQMTLTGRVQVAVSPGTYLRLIKSNGELVKRTKLIAPKLGSNDFGKIQVELIAKPGFKPLS